MNVTLSLANNSTLGAANVSGGTITSDEACNIVATGTTPVSAWITAVSLSELRAGAPIYTAPAAPVGYFFNKENGTLPAIVSVNQAGTADKNLVVGLTGTGNESALGAQMGYLTVTLSAFCLSGNGDVDFARVAVDTTTIVLSTSATAINTALEGFTSAAEFRRLALLGYR